MSTRLGTTITKKIMEEQRQFPGAKGDFSGMLYELVVALKVIAYEVNKAGLMNILGQAGTTNVQGEIQQKLDVFANTTIIHKMDHTGYLCGMASEEVEGIIEIADKHPQGGKYVLLFDPLDGSTNIDVNVSIGTIFSIYKKKSNNPKCAMEDFLQPGSNLLAAGYAVYGSSTMFVYSTGLGVHGFTLDPGVGEFILSHPNIKSPPKGRIYSVNEGNRAYWDDRMKKMVGYFTDEDEATGRPYSSRYIGSLVADFHRNLMLGGIFMYPPDRKSPGGKLRLMYEAIPLAFIAEQAGGGAVNANGERILEIQPESLHQRTPLFIGSKEEVEISKRFLAGG
ncbi:MAG: class 1 fructose-bisphosphatase [Nitrospinae bacterium]|nr:class 1 fructose-bisphosphatase [Nitrospinota bacterium]